MTQVLVTHSIAESVERYFVLEFCDILISPRGTQGSFHTYISHSPDKQRQLLDTQGLHHFIKSFVRVLPVAASECWGPPVWLTVNVNAHETGQPQSQEKKNHLHPKETARKDWQKLQSCEDLSLPKMGSNSPAHTLTLRLALASGLGGPGHSNLHWGATVGQMSY